MPAVCTACGKCGQVVKRQLNPLYKGKIKDVGGFVDKFGESVAERY